MPLYYVQDVGVAVVEEKDPSAAVRRGDDAELESFGSAYVEEDEEEGGEWISASGRVLRPCDEAHRERQASCGCPRTVGRCLLLSGGLACHGWRGCLMYGPDWATCLCTHAILIGPFYAFATGPMLDYGAHSG